MFRYLLVPTTLALVFQLSMVPFAYLWVCLLASVATPARATSLCATGRAQSPINIQTAALAREARPDAAVSALRAKYHHCPAAVGAGKDQDGDMVRFTGDFGEAHFPDGVYHAKEVHVHSPGEHLVDGVRSALEPVFLGSSWILLGFFLVPLVRSVMLFLKCEIKNTLCDIIHY